MSDKNSAVFGIYSTPAALEAAVDALRAKGFQSADISVLSVEKPGSTAIALEHDPALGASPGPGAVAAVGGALGWLVGLSALAMAGSVFLVAGPVMAALARMGETVADIAGALVGIGIPESAAKQYQGRITSGAMLLSVHTGDLERLSQGKQVFEQTGAEDITATSAPTSYSPPEGGLLPFAGMNRPANAEPVGAPVIDLLGLAAVGVKP